MKIFNWVHRRFIHKDGKLAENAKKNCVIGDDEYEKPFLLENKASFDHHYVFDGWNEGILTIGTFGYEEDNHELQNDDVSSFIKKDRLLLLGGNELSGGGGDDDDRQIITDSDEEEEVNPLVHAACNTHDYYEGLNMGMNKMSLLMEGNRDLKKFRTTLAELFSADSDDQELHEKQGFIKGEVIKEKKSTRPIYCKLQRLIRRVVKRKVHPDMGLLHKHNPNVINKCSTTTSALLQFFPTQDADI